MRLPVLSEPVTPLVPLEQEIPAMRRALQERVQELMKEATCRPGCAACCRHLVPLAPAEARKLREVVDQMPRDRREEVRRRFDAVCARLEADGLLELLVELALDPGAVPEDGRSWLARRYFSQWIDCPFLIEETCSIYDERPLACRIQAVSSDPRHCRRGGAGVVPIRIPGPPLVRALSRLENAHWQPLALLFRLDLPKGPTAEAVQWHRAMSVVTA